MTRLMPLRNVVVTITNQATRDNPQEIKKAVKSWHNGLNNGTIPRILVTKLGRQLFLDLDQFETWLKEKRKELSYRGPGRPRTK